MFYNIYNYVAYTEYNGIFRILKYFHHNISMPLFTFIMQIQSVIYQKVIQKFTRAHPVSIICMFKDLRDWDFTISVYVISFK